MSLPDELQKLHALHSSGVLSDEQFEAAKNALVANFVGSGGATGQVAKATTQPAPMRPRPSTRYATRIMISSSVITAAVSLACWVPFVGAVIIIGNSQHRLVAAATVTSITLAAAASCFLLTLLPSIAQLNGATPSAALRLGAPTASIALLVAAPSIAAVVLDGRTRILEHSGLAIMFGLPLGIAVVVSSALLRHLPSTKSSSLALTWRASLVVSALLVGQIIYFDFIVFANARFFFNQVDIVVRHLSQAPEVIFALVANVLTIVFVPPLLVAAARDATSTVYDAISDSGSTPDSSDGPR